MVGFFWIIKAKTVMAKKKLSALELLLKKISVLIDAKYATKAEAGADFATLTEARRAMSELT